ncbi:MAG: hypothetical protein N2688_01835 [Burkholderiaceae bacterium]|nr:hypothetical protein [Burkholderiaceae bacterium]
MSEHLVELRGEVPREVMDVIDAVVQATPGASRMSIVREILSEWVDRKVHEATLIQRVRRGNGCRAEAARNCTGS